MGENCTGQLVGEKIRGKEQAEGPVAETMQRKCLVDISNLPQPNHGLKFQAYSPNTKEFIHKLQQENVSLKKFLADKIKIIQFRELELQKLRTICLQVQQKNQVLAQANSQMLGELNAAKDKLKVIQHEIGCKNSLLAARNLESEVELVNCDQFEKPYKAEEKNNVPCSKKRMRKSQSLDNSSVKPVQVEENVDKKRRHSINFDNVGELPTEDVFERSHTLSTDKATQKDNKVEEKRRRSKKLTRSIQEQQAGVVARSDDLNPPTVELAVAEQTIDKETESKNKVDDKSRRQSRRQSTRLKVKEEEPVGTAESNDNLDLTTEKPVQPEMKTADKSLCSRRQSARFQQRVQDSTRELSQIDDSEVRGSPLNKRASTSSARTKFDTPECARTGSEDVESRRTSRPKRQATEKVQSYKEIPVNIKMRRCE